MPGFDKEIKWEFDEYPTDQEIEARLKANNYPDGVWFMMQETVRSIKVMIENCKVLARMNSDSENNYSNYAKDEEKELISKGTHYLNYAGKNVVDKADADAFSNEFQEYYEKLTGYMDKTKFLKLGDLDNNNVDPGMEDDLNLDDFNIENDNENIIVNEEPKEEKVDEIKIEEPKEEKKENKIDERAALDRKAKELYDEFMKLPAYPIDIKNEVASTLQTIEEEANENGGIKHTMMYGACMQVIANCLKKIPANDRPQPIRDFINHVNAYNKEPEEIYTSDAPSVDDYLERYDPLINQAKYDMIKENPEMHGVMGLDNVDNLMDNSNLILDNVRFYDDVEGYEPERVNAARYIEEIRDKGFKETIVSRLSDEQKEDYCEKFFKIMVTRMLVNSKRNKGSSLEKDLPVADIDIFVEQNKDNEIFKGFFESLKNDNDKMLTAILGAQRTPGHGGKLDDMFKEYILNLPPGRLDNDAMFDRWLPTVKDRIESIQNQIKLRTERVKKLDSVEAKLSDCQEKGKHPGNLLQKKEELLNQIENVSVDRAAAEILVLRNMAKANRKKKETLNIKVPTSLDTKLIDTVIELDDHGVFDVLNYDNPNNRNLWALLTEGHGGAFVEALRAKNEEIVNPGHENEVEKHLYKNTIKQTLKDMGTEADYVLEDLKETGVAGLKDAKIFIQKYFFLTTSVWDRNTNTINQNLLKTDTPWLELKKIDEKGLNYNKDFNNFIKVFGYNDLKGALKVIKDNADKPLEVRNQLNTMRNTIVQRMQNEQQQMHHEAPKNQAGKGMRPM